MCLCHCVCVCVHWGCSLVIADRKVGFPLCRTKERKEGRCIGSCSWLGTEGGFPWASHGDTHGVGSIRGSGNSNSISRTRRRRECARACVNIGCVV